VIVSVLLPWVTIAGRPLDLGFGLLSVTIVPGGKTVAGTGTSVWPILFGVGLLIMILSLVPRAGRLLAVLGGLIALAGAGLVYYVEDIIAFKTAQHGALAGEIAGATITSRTGPGPPLLFVSGLVILVGGLAASARPAVTGSGRPGPHPGPSA